MTKLELEDDTVDDLLDVLGENEDAVGRRNGIRWSSEAAEKISDIKEKIKAQA